MNTQILVYGFIGLAGFTLVVIGSWQGIAEIWGSGVSLLTYLLGNYQSNIIQSIKSKMRL